MSLLHCIHHKSRPGSWMGSSISTSWKKECQIICRHVLKPPQYAVYSTKCILQILLPCCLNVHLWPFFFLHLFSLISSARLEPIVTIVKYHCKLVVILILELLQPIFVSYDLRFPTWRNTKRCQYWNRFNLYGRSQYVFSKA